ncbi:Chalcone and stilbene synthases-like protein [Plesiocystis pacifica SIR-1]|uniref:Chalcone and stilbene synthases-like protein n=1 Tax=Plesiocystis pacifica SIR-1 TaxID=391625 RepID=A6G2V0_9BACT|nr:hypothetical protein [Plesiocystis pacifica]EDM79800.1 Chalcone and stilbene synthases-like protein [Plesiocystis pacifica SIR-1]
MDAQLDRTRGPAYLRGLTFSPGQFRYAQEELAEAMLERLSELAGAHRIGRLAPFLYERSGILARNFELRAEEIACREDWMHMVNEATLRMATRVLVDLFAEHLGPRECDALIVVNDGFMGFPSLGRVLQSRLGIAEDALVFDLTGHGGCGAVHGLQLADQLLSPSCANVVVVCVDALGTHALAHQHSEAPSVSEVVAGSLPSDGAAAVVVSREPGEGAALRYCGASSSTRSWPAKLELGDDDRELGAELRNAFDAQSLTEPLLLHAGGSLLDHIEGEFPELRETTALTRALHAQRGNVGAASLLQTLDVALRGHMRIGPRLRLAALTPGVGSATLTLGETCIELAPMQRADPTMASSTVRAAS